MIQPELIAATIAEAGADAASICGSRALAETRIIEALRDLSGIWENLFPTEQQRLSRLLLEGVVVKADGLAVTLAPLGLSRLSAELAGQDQEAGQ